MTTPSTERKAGPLLGTGAQTTWPFTFKVFAATDIAVTIADSLGVETALTYGVHYTVTLNANQETSPGGTVTYPISGSPLPVGSRLVIVGNLPYDQPLDLPAGGNFSPLALENELDRLTMQIQQLRERVGRALQVSVTTGANVGLPAPSANELIGWDSTGQNLQNFALNELATAVAYATMRYDTFTGDGVETQFTLTADPVTLANLDVAISGVTQVPGSDYSLLNGVLVFASAPPNGAEILARYGEGLVNVGGDSSDIRFLPAGTGAEERTVQAKLREVVSVKDFGAVGDGVTDDTAAVQATIDNSDGDVFFPPGVYAINQQLILPSNSFYDNTPGRRFFGNNASILVGVGGGTPMISASNYTAKWTFNNLTYVGNTAEPMLFDGDNIYNSWIQNNVFKGIRHVIYSTAYIQSLVVDSNHFASCVWCVDAERAYNFTFSKNYVEACSNGVIIDGTNDPALSMVRISDNVMEGGGLAISLGAVYGGIISGNYFEQNTAASVVAAGCYIKLNTGTSTHRGLSVHGNQFQLSAGQIADTGFYAIKISNPVNGANDRPAFFSNVCSGPRLVSGKYSAYFSNFAAGATPDSEYPILQNELAYNVGSNLSFVNNRSANYSAGTWVAFAVNNVANQGVLDVDAVLRLSNSGGTVLGVTYVKLTVGVTVDGTGAVRAALLGPVQLVEQAGAINGSNNYYTGYWNLGGTSAATVTVSGGKVIVSIDRFNDYSYPSFGTVVSLAPIVSARLTTNAYQNVVLTRN